MSKYLSITAISHRCSVASLAIATILLCLGLGAPRAAAQPKLGVEVYGFAGGYHFGNGSHVLKNRLWAPSYGAGVFLPVLSKWGLLIDGVASRLTVAEGPHGPGTLHSQVTFFEVRRDIVDDSVTTQQLLSIHPSFVRRWKRDRLTFYFGGGIAFEHQRQSIRYRQVNYFDESERESVMARGLPFVDATDLEFGDESGLYALSDQYTDSKDSVTPTALTVRGGVLMDVSKRVMVRMGYSYILTYIDTAPSQSIEVGIGYRF